MGRALIRTVRPAFPGISELIVLFRDQHGAGVMDRNIGPEDRVVRIVVALGLAVLIYLKVLTGAAAMVAGIVAAYLVLSGLLARCVVYRLIDVDTSVQEQPYSTTDDRADL